MNRKDTTEFLRNLLIKERLTGRGKYWASEVSIDYGTSNVKRVDFVQFEPKGVIYQSDAERIVMVTTERGYCNWEYTGEYDTDKNGYVKKTEWKTDCGEIAYWTRNNKIGEVFKQFKNQSVPVGQRFPTNCPYCGEEE